MRTKLSTCRRKLRFSTEAEAREAAVAPGRVLRPYRCDRCGAFHLTGRTRGKRIARPAEIEKEIAVSSLGAVAGGRASCQDGEAGEGDMKHYRVNKLAKAGGAVVKRKDILAPDDRAAIRAVADDPDCPICDVYADGKKIGSIV
jgi:hypothetical protein